MSSAPKHYLISIIMIANTILSKNEKPTQEYKNRTRSPEIYAHLPSPLPIASLLLRFSLLWSFLPGYLFNLDYKLFEAGASILRGLKSIIANLGHSIKELFINKALLQDESDLSVMTLTSIQHVPCTVVQLTVLGRAQGVMQSLLLRFNVCKSWYMFISFKKLHF